MRNALDIFITFVIPVVVTGILTFAALATPFVVIMVA